MISFKILYYIPKFNVNGQHNVHVIVAPMAHHPSSPKILKTPAILTVFPSEVLCKQFVTSTLTTIKHDHISTSNQHNKFCPTSFTSHKNIIKSSKALRPLAYVLSFYGKLLDIHLKNVDVYTF